jgi:tryptophan synthase alpha chain
VSQRLDTVFAERASARHAALITYIMAGDPNLEASADLAMALQEAGADIIEFGVPFSDPIADGPVIAAAGQRALDNGTTLARVLDTVRDLRARGLSVPLVLMGYLNPILRMGYAAFADRAAAAGVDGLIVPDLPFDEGAALFTELDRAGIASVQLVAPTSPDARVKMVAARSRGFLYYVSLTGVTGVRDRLPDDVVQRIRHVRSLSAVPIGVGFGVSSPAMARGLGEVADGVVVGSAIVSLVATHGQAAIEPVRDFVRDIRKALDEVKLAVA